MITTHGRIVKATLTPLYWFGNYAAYDFNDDLIVANIATGKSVKLESGKSTGRRKEAETFLFTADRMMADATLSNENVEEWWNELCLGYEIYMLAPELTGGAPSSDGSFFAFFD